MATRRAAFVLTAPSVPVFAIALVLAILALVANYGGVTIPLISAYIIETLILAFALLTAGVLARGL
jgi:high-affinity Fe2+/Pb2+ permease